MKTKQRLLKALDCSLEDISEDRLVDILLDTFNAKKRRIEELEGDNARERFDIQNERDRMRDELHRMRSDPLYGAGGEYYFMCDGKKFGVVVQGRISMFERRGSIDYAAQQLSPREWSGV